jgi:hypothetical protein
MRIVRFLLLFLFPVSAAAQTETPWAATLYAGPATASSSSQIFFHGDFTPDAAMVGLALDRHLVDVGWGFDLEGEGQATHFAGRRNYDTMSLALGMRFHDFPWDRPTSIALFTGPSWADDPPPIGTGTFHGVPIRFAREAWLESVGAELAVSISEDNAWSAALRFYHRSGAFGLFADNADEGSMVGIGIRRQF